MLKFAKTHEWINIEGDIATVGISEYAVVELRDLVYVELPAVGKVFEKNASFGVVEAVKAASDIYMPCSGEVIEINQGLADCNFDLLKDPYGAGFLIKVKFKEVADGLMSLEEYTAFTKKAH